MKKPTLPYNESSRQARLDALAILDTEPEERYDRIVRLAAAMFVAPVALMSLVDRDRQWIKSSFGLNVLETPRDISFCGHAILQEKPLVVLDALGDDRFVDNPLVISEPHIRFYAGQPIKTPDGSAIGTLCVIDIEPRAHFSDTEIQSLRDLAVLIEQEVARTFLMQGPIGNRYSPRDNLTAEYEAMLRSSGNVTLLVDPDLKLKQFTMGSSEFFCLDPSSPNKPMADIDNYLNFPELLKDLVEVSRYGEPIERRINSINGKTLQARLQAFREPGAARDSVIISLVDMTAQLASTHLERIFDGLGERIAAIDGTGRIVYTNNAWESFARENGDPLGLKTGLGANYLDVCRLQTDKASIEVLNALEQMLKGERVAYSTVYECSWDEVERYFVMNASAVNPNGFSVIISHTEISPLFIGNLRLNQGS